MIYLVHEKWIDNPADYSVYPYRLRKDAIQRISNETGKSIEEIESKLNKGISSGHFIYFLEETELF